MTNWKKVFLCALSFSLVACGIEAEKQAAVNDAESAKTPSRAQHDEVLTGTPGPVRLVVADNAQGQEASSSVDPMANRYGIILIDRTGSMMEIRTTTSRTRCEDAIIQAKNATTAFFSGPTFGTHLSIWTFTNTSVTKHTGYVNYTAAMTALNALNPTGCSGGTPLADAMCFAADELNTLTPKPTYLHLATDGYENASTGPCSGPMGDYHTAGTWQNKVFNKLISVGTIAKIQFWVGPTTLQSMQNVNALSYCGTSAKCEDQLFQALAAYTGGTYAPVKDNDPAYPCGPGQCPEDDSIYW